MDIDDIKKQVGIVLMFFGIASILLGWCGIRYGFLVWMDHWGVVVAYILKLGLFGAGFYLYRSTITPSSW